MNHYGVTKNQRESIGRYEGRVQSIETSLSNVFFNLSWLRQETTVDEVIELEGLEVELRSRGKLIVQTLRQTIRSGRVHDRR